MGSNNIKFNNCKICGKKINSNFYDKSVYRPICSRKCYSKYIDSLPKRYDKKLRHAIIETKDVMGEYYMKGHLVLSNYNLSKIY